MEQSRGERDAPLLAAAQRLDDPMAGRQVQQFKQEIHLRSHERSLQLVNAAKVFESFTDSEFTVQGQFLGHVTDPGPWDATLGAAGLAAENQNFTSIETSAPYKAAQESRLTATTGTQETVSVCNRLRRKI